MSIEDIVEDKKSLILLNKRVYFHQGQARGQFVLEKRNYPISSPLS